MVGSRTTVLDLTAFTSAHESGRRFLEMLHQEGVEFLARSDFQSYLAAGITGAAQAYFRRRVEAVEESDLVAGEPGTARHDFVRHDFLPRPTYKVKWLERFWYPIQRGCQVTQKTPMALLETKAKGDTKQ